MARRTFIAAIFVLGLACPAKAQQDDAPGVFPLYTGDSLSVRLDLSSLLTAERVSRLEDGVALRCDISVELRRPRKLWGSHLQASSNASHMFSYSMTTKRFAASALSQDSVDEVFLPSVAALHRHLADSVILTLRSNNGFDSKSHYFLEVAIDMIWLTSLNEAADGSVEASDQSELAWMFDQFLRLTGYGRESIEFQTDDFRLSDIRSE
jgi:hypothetical protein